MVRFLKTNSGKKGEGMPVFRNPQFYFKEGFCWNLTLNEFSEYFKVRFKAKGVNDVNAMALYPYDEKLAYYYVALLNSYFVFHYKRAFVSGNSAFQINDARQLPIIIPSDETLNKIERLVRKAINLASTSNTTEQEDGRLLELENIREKLDYIICSLYKFQR